MDFITREFHSVISINVFKCRGLPNFTVIEQIWGMLL